MRFLVNFDNSNTEILDFKPEITVIFIESMSNLDSKSFFQNFAHSGIKFNIPLFRI